MLLLLHGFPTSSNMFRNLIPKLAAEFHVIAPDYIGYGFSSMPSHETFAYTFENQTNYIEKLTRELRLEKYILYVMDYGAPIGYRLAIRQPGAGRRANRSEWQRIRRRAFEVLGSDQGILEGSVRGERRQDRILGRIRRDQMAISKWSE